MLTDWRKIEDRIGKAREALSKRRVIERRVAELVARESDPSRTLAIPYGLASKPTYTKGFTEEEDRFLLCMLNALGSSWLLRRGHE